MRKRDNQYLGLRQGSLFKRQTEQPQTLYKASNLFFDEATNTVRLSSVALISHTTAMNADAKCFAPDSGGEGEGSHLTYPARFCHCGFHGYAYYADAVAHSQVGDVILRVVASGKMFEYEKGYRFGHQRVEEIVISGCRAVGCHSEAERFFLHTMKDECFLKPVCAKHSQSGKSMSFELFEEIVSRTLPDKAPRIIVSRALPDMAPSASVSQF